jgi:uncharacterized membrane protein required for colicin V production
MTIFDFILLLIIGGFVMSGLWFGLIHSLGALVGTILGAFFALKWYEPVAAWASFLFGDHQNLARIVCFLLIFIIIDRLVGLLFWIIDKFFSVLKFIPFLKTINRLVGGVFGFLEGVLVLGITLFFVGKYPLGEWFTGVVADSKVADYLTRVGKVFLPLFPEMVNWIKSLI